MAVVHEEQEMESSVRSTAQQSWKGEVSREGEAFLSPERPLEKSFSNFNGQIGTTFLLNTCNSVPKENKLHWTA